MALTEFEKQVRRRLRDDFVHYARKCLRIRSKRGAMAGKLPPFELNPAQLYIHSRLEKQLRERGYVRAIILKGRQQGCSTYVGGRFYWKVTQRRGVRAYILTHEQPATDNLFAMTVRYHQNCPELVKPSTGTANAKELNFDALDSGYAVGTAGSKGTGRSSTIQYFHGSEVAFWPNAATHMRGVMQAVPLAEGTEVILESTSDGPQGLFYKLCMAAHRGAKAQHLDERQLAAKTVKAEQQGLTGPEKRDKQETSDEDATLEAATAYELIFVPWFWQPEYSIPLKGKPFTRTAEEVRYADQAYAVHGTALLDEQLAWRRFKISEFEKGVQDFKREYPATVEEAFEASALGALWDDTLIETAQVPGMPCGEDGEPLEFIKVGVAVDPSSGSGPNATEAGIIKGGLATDGKAYLWKDCSGIMPPGGPKGWPAAAVGEYHSKPEANVVVAENNFGGEMVERCISIEDRAVPVEIVHAARGKDARAEVAVARYRKGLVKHVGGRMKALEREQTTWVPGESDWSPNRMDAAVWLLYYLFEGAEPMNAGSF